MEAITVDSPTKTYSNRDKRYLLEKIARLSHTEHEEIFRIIKSAGIPFTQNKNGLFINITQVDNAHIEKIDRFVEFCLKNKQELDEYDKRIIECKMSNSFDMLANPNTSTHMGNVSDKERKPLNSILTISPQEKELADNWHKVIQESRVDEKIATFANHLEENIERIQKKKGNTKFLNAKKKFSRKLGTSDKNEMMSVLVAESYIITRA